jgi:FkbM family methyltransferase
MRNLKTSRAVSVLLDYCERLRSVLRGFQHLGPRWAPAALAYLLHPLLRRVLAGRELNFGGYRARIGECDLFVLGNLFQEYDVSFIQRILPHVERVIDAGANVGAFAFLIERLKPGIEIIAIEPDAENFRRLQAQPFARRIDCRNEAIAALPGTCKVIKGTNSATHHVEPLTSNAVGEVVPCLTLNSLPTKPTLLKLDVEGAEKPLLADPLPDWVRAVVMEWHFPDESPQALFPAGMLKKGPGAGGWSWQRA